MVEVKREDKEIVLKFTLQGLDFETAGEASGKIKLVLQQLGIGPDVIRRISISAYEGEMNVIIHAFRGIMQANISPVSTVITLEDQGPGIADIELAMKEGYSTAPDYVREMGFGAGMGLPNMMRCTDKFEIQSKVGEGTKIQMTVFHNSSL